MYLYHFGFRKLPFSLTPDTALYCALKTYGEALNTLQFALNSGEAFCKITGEVGSGKTMLCRLLMNKIGEKRKLAYIPNPVLTPRELKLALAMELNMRIAQGAGEEQLIPKIQKKLIAECKKKGPVILVIDEAQSMPDDTLEALRLFTNLETESHKLLQIILLGQPELDDKLSQNHLRQLRQRIGFSYHLTGFSFQQTCQYINHRIGRVDKCKKIVFQNGSFRLLHYFSRGVPRLINILSHKSLMLTFGKKSYQVTSRSVWMAAQDTEDTRMAVVRIKQWVGFLLVGFVSSSATALWILP